MRTLSDALPVQFWPIADLTYNESQFGFTDKIPFYQQFQSDDPIKLQLVDDDITTAYTLLIYDVDGNLIDSVPFVRTGIYHQLTFTAATLTTPIADACVQLFIGEMAGPFDDTFDDTFHPLEDSVYKSDFIQFLSQIPLNQSWGSKLIGYKSAKNFAGIKYPNDDSYFYLRVPCQFFRQRPKTSQETISLSGAQVINTSITKGLQQLMKVIYSPDYIHNKLQLIFQHAASGVVLIDGKNWTIEEAYELQPPDERSPFQLAKIWLSDKNYFIRNMI